MKKEVLNQKTDTLVDEAWTETLDQPWKFLIVSFLPPLTVLGINQVILVLIHYISKPVFLI